MTTPHVSLPIRTNFCAADLVVGERDDGQPLRFYLDGNSKITRSNGTYGAPVPNAFSLPAASVGWMGRNPCPGSTPACRGSCYVRSLAKHAPDLYARYEENAAVLAAILPRHNPAQYAAIRLATWIANHAPGGFRWHVSGDVWNEMHAAWIVDVCKYTPQVPYWIYTRTLDVVATLRRAANLAVNVSADPDNYEAARAVAVANSARVCYLATSDRPLDLPRDLPDGSVIFPDYPARGRDLEVPTKHPWWVGISHHERTQVCPADFFGQSEANRCGPCGKCLT
jgi:hypothetical protein